MAVTIDLTGRAAVVTGGGRGIGAAVAAALAAAGARVVVAARNAVEIERVAGELIAAGHAALAVPCDVTDPESVAHLAREAEGALGFVDILVNNAGVAGSAKLAATDLAEWNRILSVNATGTYLCTRTFLPGMLTNGWGRVVNVASVAGLMGAAYVSAYTASKHAVVGFTRAMAVEVAAKGVTVNALCPGFVATPMTDESVSRISAKTGLAAAEARRKIEGMSPQGRLIEPEEVAFAVLTLCDARSKGINGQAIAIDGGGLRA